MANNKVITFDDFVEGYNALIKRADEIGETIAKMKFSIKPSAMKQRKELTDLLMEVNGRLDELDAFAMETCTYDNRTLVSFMTRFYSFFYNKQLRAIEIHDNKYSKYAERAYIVVTEEDYERLTREFDFDRAVNSDKVLKKCKNQEFLYLSGKKKAQLLDGLSLDENFAQFPEIEEVLHIAIAYKLNNKSLQNKACLEMALDDYINKHSNIVMGPDLLHRPLDDSVSEDIIRNVQQIMDEDLAARQQAARQQASAQSQQIPRQQEQPAGATQGRDAAGVSRGMLYMLDDMYKMQQDMGDEPVQTVPQPVSQPVQRPVQQPVRIVPQPVQRPVQPVQQPVQQPVRTVQQPVGGASQTRLFSPVRVTRQEEAPQQKATQYRAGSSVLLNMLDDMLSLDDDQQKRFGK